MVYQNNRQNVMLKGFGNSFMNSTNVKYHINHKQQLNNRNQNQLKGQNLQQFNNAVHELCSMYDAVNYFGKSEFAKKNGWRIINKHQLNTATIYAIRYAPVVPKRSATTKKQPIKQQQRPQSRQQPKQQPKQQSKQMQIQQFNNAVHELCSMYDAVNYFGKSEYAKKNGWTIINKHQLNAATINAIRNAPVVPKRTVTSKKQPQIKQQSKQQLRQQPINNRKQKGGRRIGGCQFKPNVPRVYNYSTTPLSNTLYPMPKNYNHLYEAFNYFGNPQVRNIKSWIESSRTHKLSSIATVFAKRNAPYVPVRQNRSNKKNQQHAPQKKIQQQRMQRNVPKQQSNKRQMKLSNVWEDYYVSPTRHMFK